MDALIKIFDNNGSQAVSARELHTFLESKQDFSTWMKNRIKKYGFIEGADFQSFDKIMEREIGATSRIEYALTIDCAKEISMVEGNEKGRQARKYFIECEKLAKTLEIQKPLSPAEQNLINAQLFVQYEKKLSEIEQNQIDQKEKIDYLLTSKQEAENSLKALPFDLPQDEVVPELSIRDKINILVRKYSTATQVQTSDIWNKIYHILYYNYKISIKSYSKIRKSESYLEVAERKGFIETVFVIASTICKIQ